VPRSSYWYRPKEKTALEQRLLKRMIELSDKHPLQETLLPWPPMQEMVKLNNYPLGTKTPLNE